MCSSGLAAKMLAEYGRRPYLSRSPLVRSSQQASRTKAEATRSKGTAKPAPGSAGQAATAAPSPLPTAANAPAGSGRSAAKSSVAPASHGIVGTPATGSGA